MDTSSFGAESHVAQQSRRDKLRIQQSSSSSAQHLGEFSNNLEQLSAGGFVQVRNVRNGNFVYDSMFSSEMLNFASSSSMVDQELGVAQPNRPHMVLQAEDSSFTNMSQSHPIFSNFCSASSPKTGTGHDPQGCGNWRNMDSQQSYDWMVTYASGSVGGESNQKPMFVGEVMSNNARVSSISTSLQYLKPNYNGYQDVQAQSSLVNSVSEIYGQDREKYLREMQFSSLPVYHSTVHDVSLASVGANERILLPSDGNQANALQFDNDNAWIGRPVENCYQWSGELGFIARKGDQELRTIASDFNTQGLSLSLSSNPPSKVNVIQLGEGCESENFQSKAGVFKEAPEDSKFVKSSYPCPMEKPSIISRSSGKSLNEIVGASNHVHRNTGPLGPFTGYATILKSSRFLKPAQELLDEICNATCSKLARTCEVSERISGEASASTLADTANATDIEYGAKGGNISGISSSIYSSNEGSGDGGDGSGSSESYVPEYQQKKAKLLYLREEVCRRYKQYYQQMQMVATSFESVAGLSASTPYVSLALKTVTRNFRCLKHAISDQLKHVTKALGEDFLSPNTIACCSKGDTSTLRLRYTDQSFQKQKFCGANVGFFEPQQHVWRPQRGLPERSVAILRAWLFDHFLHPYPTDTDKHMLATQTGLSRNQVSNWFINARVRVWKPMVEEIHMLESKGLAETNQSSGKIDANSAEGTSQATNEQPSKKLGTDSMLNKKLECPAMRPLLGREEQMDAERWNKEKSRGEFLVPTSMEGSSMHFLPYQRNTIDVGGLGAVSLTLGLRHGVENAQQQHQQQLQEHEDQLRRQFGGQMIHDFVG